MPTLHGNYIDLLILIVLIIYAWEGIERGFLALAGEMTAFVLSFVMALRFYPLLAELLIANFTLSRAFANALGFIIAAITLEMAIGIGLASLLRKIPRKWHVSPANRISGFIPALVDALILIAFILSALVALPVSGTLKSDVLASRLGSVILSQTSTLEKSLDQIFGGAAQETLSFLTIEPNSRESVDLHFKVANYTVDQASEDRMLQLINQERSGRGLGRLALDPKLRDVGRVHSQDMFVRGYFAHIDPDGKDPFQRMVEAGISFTTAGENLAYAPSVELAHSGLMNSPGHRANILNPEFHRIGIGAIDGGFYGKMFSQEFAN